MTKAELIHELRVLLCDTQSVGYPDNSELENYLDRATVYYSEKMIAMKSPEMLKRMPVVGCVDLPDDFVALAGQHPVQVTGRHMDYYGEVPYKITYWSTLPLPSSYGEQEEVPHTSTQDSIILELARVFALNRNEYDLSQDLKLEEIWNSVAKGARS